MQILSIINQIVWDVTPEIIEGFHVRWYGLFFAIGFMVAYYILSYIFKQEGKSVKQLDGITFAAFIGLIIGLRLGHCLFYQPDYYLSNPIEILYIWEGGLASHGGAIGLIIAFAYYSRKHKIDLAWIISRAAIVIPVTGGMVRLGNLMNSEIYGLVTELPWGFIFVRDGETLARHPTQIYEALSYFLIFIIMFLYYKRNQKINNVSSNLLLAMGFGLIFLARFIIEFVKTEQVEFEKGMALTMGQYLSIPFIMLAVFFVFRHYKLKKIKS
jgi:phosphatidylglycerol---prolipoprotein diacylglyceryl transferase